MFEILTTETLLTGGILGASALAFAGGIVMMRSHRQQPRHADLEAAVQHAPYHRLHNVLPHERS